MTGGFVGCIRYPSLQGTSFGSPSADFATQPCSGSMESGTFIGDGGGNVQLSKYITRLNIISEINKHSPKLANFGLWL